VSLAVSGGSLEFTLSYVIDYADRTAMKDLLFTQIAEEVTKSEGRLAWASSSSSGQARPSAADVSPSDSFHILRQK
jgi:hypothetical protein